MQSNLGISDSRLSVRQGFILTDAILLGFDWNKKVSIITWCSVNYLESRNDEILRKCLLQQRVTNEKIFHDSWFIIVLYVTQYTVFEI